VIDWTFVKEQLDYRPGVFENLLSKFKEWLLKEDEPALRAAHEAGDLDGLKALAHKLKGAAVYCGALRLKEACDRLETYIGLGKTELVDDLYHLVLEEARKVRESV
jgi:HPt (histidine-containing phosphotransfer) domain-containing protein